MFAALIARIGIQRRLAMPLLVLPLLTGAYGILLKAHRAALYPGKIAVYARPLLVVSDLAFAIGFFAFCLALGVLFTRIAWPRIALVIAQVFALLLIPLLTLAHGYYLATGQTLDYPMFAFALGRANETASIVGGEAHGPLLLGLLAVPLLLIVGPWWLWRRRAAVELTPAPRSRFALTLSACLLASALAFVGTIPARLKGVERSFTRDPISYLTLGAYQALVPRERYRGKPTRLRKVGATDLVAKSPAASGEKPKNLVVILLESTRWDATTPYNAALKTTPNLAALSKDGVHVERAYAVVPHTSKALVTIMCGFEPEMTLNVIESQRGALPGKCLPELLSRQGYETIFFQAPTSQFEQRSVLVKNLGFQRFRSGDDAPHRGLERINYFGYEDAVMLDPSQRWLEQLGGKPFFAAYLTTASHHPYGYPRKHRTRPFTKNKDKNRYLNAVHYVDEVVGKIVDQYKKLGLYDDTVFVVLGDHGEAFGEHGLYAHDDVMFEEGIRIPLVMHLPRSAHAGTRIAGPLNELSIVPTVLDVLGFAPGSGSYEASSWFEKAAEPALYASCYRPDHCASVLHGSEKLIYYFDERDPSMFDVSKDPSEEDDLADSSGKQVDALTKELLDLRLAVHETYRTTNARALSAYVSRTKPDVQTPLVARFGKYLELLGYRAPSQRSLSTFGRGQYRRFEIDTYFHVLQTPPPGYRLRNELRGELQSKLVYRVPIRGLLPLTDFRPGFYVDDAHRIDLPDEWTSQTLTVCLALVDENDIPVPVSGPGLDGKPCVPLLTTPTLVGKAPTLPKLPAIKLH